jgi:L-alanine-DL-glutamate epimerase-like enolase superfamily enzyme
VADLDMKNSANKEGAPAAELALKAHALASDPEILTEITERVGIMHEIVHAVNLTEAPEDAVCSLVIDLLKYCEREKIDWNEDVMSRAGYRFFIESAGPQK